MCTLRLFLLTIKQRKCINISYFGHFLLNLPECVKFQQCHTLFYLADGRNGRDKSQLWIPNPLNKPSLWIDSAMQHFMIEAVS